VNFSRFQAATRISRVNCAKMAGDRPKTTCIWNFQHWVFYQSKSGPSRFENTCARGCQRRVPF